MNFFGAIAIDLNFVLVLSRLCKIIWEVHLRSRLGRAAKCFCQANGHFRADAGLAIDDVVQRLPGDTKQLCSVGDG